MSALPGISDAVLERANLTPKQLTALRLYNPPERGYRSVALALDCSRDNARYLVTEGLRKLRLALEAEPLVRTYGTPPARARHDDHRPDVVDIHIYDGDGDEPAGIRAFAD